MGVVSVICYPVPEGKSGQQAVEFLQKRIETLGAEKTGTFFVDCETYQNVQTPQRAVHILHNSEQPASVFAVTDANTCLVADVLFELLMAKLKGYFAVRKSAKFESKGQRYELGDFIIKIGSVTQSVSFKGILVEVEYCPCLIPTDCWGLMKEFLQGFMGNCVDSMPNHMKNKMDQSYTPADTIMQYIEHFNILRKTPIQTVGR